MTIFRSWLFNSVFYLGSVIYAIIMLPCLITVPSTRWGILLWVKLSFGCMWLFLGLRHDARGIKNMPESGALIACKHQSAWETIALWQLVPNSLFVMKQELYSLPVIGWWIRRAGNIGIDRSGGSATMKKLIRETKDRLAKGHNLIIFPEGTRTTPNETTTYQNGIAALAKVTKAPVVPVGLNSGIYWPRNALIKQSGTIQIVFMPPITAGKDSAEFIQQLQLIIEEQSRALL